MAKNIDIPDGWEVKKLGEVFQKINKKNKENLIHQVLTNSAQYGVIPQEAFFDKSIATKENINNYYILNIDDFIYNPRISKYAPAGPISRNKYEIGCVSPLYTVFRIRKNYNIDFFESYFKSNLWNKQAYNVANFGARFDRMNITDNDFFNIPIPVPPLDEQKKIADILSLWDKAIQQTKELIAYKETQKKGLMQNLLTGKKRLHGFNDDWKTIKLGEVAEITTGNKNNEDKIENGLYPFFVRSKNIEKINTYSFDGEAILVPGDGNIGDIYHYINGKFDFHQRVYKISNFKLIYGKFLYYNMQVFFKKRAISQTSKATVNSLRMNTFTQYKIFMPVNIDEQKAIADILLKADEEINLLNKQLDLYTEQKKGLMQNLLTGKIRV